MGGSGSMGAMIRLLRRNVLLAALAALGAAAPMAGSECFAAAPGRARSTQEDAPPSKPGIEQIQFWVGAWDVTDNGRTIGTSDIQSIAGGHALLENYSQPGFSGKSLTFVDGALGKWRQIWVDSMGRVSEFVGESRGNAMHFEGETRTSDGKRMKRRMVLEPLEGDRVRHHSERSEDEGRTWVTVYSSIYTKRL